MIDLDEKSLQTVKAILGQCVPECKALAFGSRVTGLARLFSDLDIALVCNSPTNWRKLEDIQDVFSASELKIMVDVLDWCSLSDSFRAIIDEHCEVLQRPETPQAFEV